MDKNELAAKLKSLLAEEFEVEEADITPEAIIKPTLMLDSLSLVDMVALIEGATGVGIKGTEAASIQTFDALYDFVYERMSKQ
jgi:acyl carrier protein